MSKLDQRVHKLEALVSGGVDLIYVSHLATDNNRASVTLNGTHYTQATEETSEQFRDRLPNLLGRNRIFCDETDWAL